MPADLIIYLIVAVALVLWLKNTLGTHEEGDEPLKNIRSALPELDELSGGSASGKGASETDNKDPIDLIKDDKSGIIGIDSVVAETGLRQILDADKGLDVKFFFTAVQDVFINVVEAFAEGDRDYLRDVLGDKVYAAFEGAIAEREDAGMRARSEVISISSARIVDAELVRGKTALITVKFLAEQIHCVHDADSNLVEGHEERPAQMQDIWVFRRDVKSKDPRWLLTETRGGFEGDNDIIPNA